MDGDRWGADGLALSCSDLSCSFSDSSSCSLSVPQLSIAGTLFSHHFPHPISVVHPAHASQGRGVRGGLVPREQGSLFLLQPTPVSLGILSCRAGFIARLHTCGVFARNGTRRCPSYIRNRGLTRHAAERSMH
jgi:hypothetical protein